MLLVAVAAAAAAPQREGAAFSNEAIKQAQNTFLIPKDAQIQKVIYYNTLERFPQSLRYTFQNSSIKKMERLHSKGFPDNNFCEASITDPCVLVTQVQEGIELAAYESIPGNQRINLFEILGDQVPSEVINNLQGQLDQVGRN